MEMLHGGERGYGMEYGAVMVVGVVQLTRVCQFPWAVASPASNQVTAGVNRNAYMQKTSIAAQGQMGIHQG
jgi:hypothetical protein